MILSSPEQICGVLHLVNAFRRSGSAFCTLRNTEFFIHPVNISLHLVPSHICISGWLKILHSCYVIIAPMILKYFFRKFIETLIFYRGRTLPRYRNYYRTDFSQRFVYAPPTTLSKILFMLTSALPLHPPHLFPQLSR